MANFLDTIKNYFNPLLNYSGYPTLDSKTQNVPTIPANLTPYQQSMLWQPSAPAKNPVQPIGSVPSYVNPTRPAGATVINGVSVPQTAPVQAIGQPAVPPVSPVTTTAPTGMPVAGQPSQKVIDIAKQRLRGYGMSETAPNYQKSLQEAVDNILINANMYGLGQNDLYQNPVADVQPIGGGVEPIGAGAKAENLRTQLTGSLSGIADAIKKLSEGTKGAEDYYNQAKEQFDPYYKDIIEGVKQRYSIERDRQLKDNESAMGSAKAVIFNTGIQDTPFSSTIEQKQRDENTKVLNALDARMNAEVSSIGSEFSGKIIAAAQKNLDNALAERNQKLSELQQQASLLKDIVQPILDSAESDEDKVLELAMKYPDAGIDPRFDDVQGSIAKLLDSPTYQEEVARAAEKEAYSMYSTPYKEYLDYARTEQDEWKEPMSFNDYQTMDANRKRSVTNVTINQQDDFQKSAAKLIGQLEAGDINWGSAYSQLKTEYDVPNEVVDAILGGGKINTQAQADELNTQKYEGKSKWKVGDYWGRAKK